MNIGEKKGRKIIWKRRGSFYRETIDKKKKKEKIKREAENKKRKKEKEKKWGG